MSVYDRIIEETAQSRQAYADLPLVKYILSDGMPREAYLELLEQLYHVVWHFCPAIATAAAHCRDDRRGLRYALYHSIDEEKGHEEWVLNDVHAMGGDREAVRTGKPAPPIQALVGYNYYVSQYVNPTGILGMVHVMEEIAATFASRAAGKIADSIGVPCTDGFSFMTSHGEMDKDHVDEFKVLVETITNPADVDALIDASRVNYAMFGALFREA